MIVSFSLRLMLAFIEQDARMVFDDFSTHLRIWVAVAGRCDRYVSSQYFLVGSGFVAVTG